MADTVSEIGNRFGDSFDDRVANKWRSGVQNPNRSPGEGLNTEIEDLDNLDGDTLEDYNEKWSSNTDTEDNEEKFVDNGQNSQDKWERNWGDASNWNI